MQKDITTSIQTPKTYIQTFLQVETTVHAFVILLMLKTSKLIELREHATKRQQQLHNSSDLQLYLVKQSKLDVRR